VSGAKERLNNALLKSVDPAVNGSFLSDAKGTRKPKLIASKWEDPSDDSEGVNAYLSGR
jgi:hypothetical protein